METEEILVAIQNAANTIAAPNWADIASVGLSLLAVVVAGFVAWKQNKIILKQAEIAEQQNKISLLEERITIYNVAFCCKSIAEKILECAKNNKEAASIFQDIAQKSLFTFSALPISREYIGETDIKLILEKLSHAEFSFSEGVSKSLVALAARLVFLMLAYNEEEFNVQKGLLRQLLEHIEEDKVFEKAKNELRL